MTAHLKHYLRVIGRLFDDLRGHPERCTNKCVTLDLSVGELSRHAKIRQLHLSLLGQQYVGSCVGAIPRHQTFREQCLHLNVPMKSKL